VAFGPDGSRYALEIDRKGLAYISNRGGFAGEGEVLRLSCTGKPLQERGPHRRGHGRTAAA
jgi:hypothetical protein